MGGVLSAVRCHRRIDAASSARGSNVSRSANYHESPLLPPFGTGRVSLGLESESRPLVTRCLAASPAIAPREARLVTSVAALHEGSREPLGTTARMHRHGLEGSLEHWARGRGILRRPRAWHRRATVRAPAAQVTRMNCLPKPNPLSQRCRRGPYGIRTWRPRWAAGMSRGLDSRRLHNPHR